MSFRKYLIFPFNIDDETAFKVLLSIKKRDERNSKHATAVMREIPIGLCSNGRHSLNISLRMAETPKGVKYSIRPFVAGGCAACFSTCCVG